jgi:hypothetical protein
MQALPNFNPQKKRDVTFTRGNYIATVTQRNERKFNVKTTLAARFKINRVAMCEVFAPW